MKNAMRDMRTLLDFLDDYEFDETAFRGATIDNFPYGDAGQATRVDASADEIPADDD